ncbi:MAG: ABC transporter permease [Candidatus Omnitrophota bacterium]
MVIKPGNPPGQYWVDIWRYRELFYFLAWRDIIVRYKQTIIGIAWSLIRPFLTLVVFTVVFSKIAKLPSYGAPYPVLVFAGLLPWQFFANALSESSNSLIDNEKLITKVYFPRFIVPSSTVIVSIVDFLLNLLILIAIMAWYRFAPGPRIMILPLFFLFAVIVAMGAGLWMATLNVKYRDFRYIVPFVIQFGLYISPVGFSSAVVPQNWRLLYSLNPMVGVIDGFRWAIIGGESHFYWPGFIISIILALVIFISGLFYFRKAEKKFADVI